MLTLVDKFQTKIGRKNMVFLVKLNHGNRGNKIYERLYINIKI